jgi:solute carrier family 25 citrate transporter 1
MGDDKQRKKIVIPKYISALAGSIGGMTEALCLQPLDVTKTRMQLDKVGKYNSIPHCVRTIIKDEGVRAMYKGLTPFVTHLTLKYALRMYSYELYRGILSNNGKNQLTIPQQLLAGLLAGCTEAVLIVTPFEVVKMRLQQQVGTDKGSLKYKNPIHCVKTILSEESPLALFKGLAPTMLRNGSNQMLNFFSVGMFNEYVWGKKRGDGVQLAFYQSILSGAIAGSLGPICNCPADVIKTRLQCQITVKGMEPKYKGFIPTFKTILQEEGVGALYKGLSLRLMRIAPGQAIMWTVVGRITTYYEQTVLDAL